MKTCFCFSSEGSKLNQFICAFFINIPVFAYGASVGWLSPTTLLLVSDQSPSGRPLTIEEISWIASISYLVCIPASYITAVIGDKAGRKVALLFMSSMNAACWVIKLKSAEPWVLVLARAFSGVSMAGAYIICPVYTKEISEDSIRGALGSIIILMQTTGNLFTYVIGDLLSYHTVLWICLAIPTFHLILFMMMPESPSYLIKTGQREEAARVLAWLRSRNEDDSLIMEEIDLIQNEQKYDNSKGNFALKSILSNKLLARAFRIAIVVVLARELCGAITVLGFAGDIFNESSKGYSLNLSANQQAMVLGAVQVVGSAIASGVVEKSGRKMLLFTTSVVSGISMFVLASWFLADQFSYRLPAWIPIITLCICIFCDASGLQPMPVVIISEIFSFKYRGTVLAISMGLASFSAFLQMRFYKTVVETVGIFTAFYFFAAVCIFNALYVLFVIPETKKRTLGEIYEDLKTKKERSEAQNSCREIENDVS